MAGTITVVNTIRVSNGGFIDAFTPGQQTITETNIGVGGGTQSVPTTSTGTAVAGLSNLTGLGWAAFQNLDATNFITIGIVVSATYQPVLKLLPGESNSLRLVPGTTYYAKADTAAVELLTRVWEN